MTLPATTNGNALALLADLEHAGALTATGLTLTTEIPYVQYEALAAMLGTVHRISAWAIGDLLNYGEKVFSESYVQAASLTGLSETTCMNYASVCKRVPKQRRRPELSFSSHEVVAKMEPADQTEWLERAVEQRWTRQELRAQVDKAAGKELPPAVERCSCCGGELGR